MTRQHLQRLPQRRRQRNAFESFQALDSDGIHYSFTARHDTGFRTAIPQRRLNCKLKKSCLEFSLREDAAD